MQFFSRMFRFSILNILYAFNIVTFDSGQGKNQKLTYVLTNQETSIFLNVYFLTGFIDMLIK